MLFKQTVFDLNKKTVYISDGFGFGSEKLKIEHVLSEISACEIKF